MHIQTLLFFGMNEKRNLTEQCRKPLQNAGLRPVYTQSKPPPERIFRVILSQIRHKHWLTGQKHKKPGNQSLVFRFQKGAIMKHFIRIICFSVCAVAAVSALAQQDASQGYIEEITVTAQKREQTLQEVPIAVTVVQAEDLERAQILDIKDLQSIVPSLRVTQLQTTGNTNFIIRGFGNGANNAGIEPSVGVFIDGVYRSRSASALADLPNLQRIEVLRGPQSTLFGKNASAGVISVVTAKPDLNDFGGSASVTVGEYDQVLVKGDVTGPLSYTAAFSLELTSNNLDVYFTNLEDVV